MNGHEYPHLFEPSGEWELLLDEIEHELAYLDAAEEPAAGCVVTVRQVEDAFRKVGAQAAFYCDWETVEMIHKVGESVLAELMAEEGVA